MPNQKKLYLSFGGTALKMHRILCKNCLQSVRKAFDGCTIVEITKHNFEDYTDIHPQILKAYRAGDISVQTFSDILRFNLLQK